MKKYIFGFIIGALIFSTIPVIASTISATKTSSNVFVDGIRVSVDSYNINGANYFKLRDFCEAINIGVWLDDAGSIQIETDKKYDVNYIGLVSQVTIIEPATTPQPISQPSKNFSKDPVEALKQVAEYHIDSYNYNNRGKPIHVNTPAIHGLSAQDYWTYTYATALLEYSYDVTTTDSLVSPYEGVITFTIVTHTSKDRNNSEAEALAEKEFRINDRNKHTHKYAWQNGEWVVIERTLYRELLGVGKDYDCTKDWCEEIFLKSNIS